MKKKLMSVLLAAAMVASMAVGQRRKQRVTRSYLTDHLH